MKTFNKLRAAGFAPALLALAACSDSGDPGTDAGRPTVGLLSTPQALLELEQPASCRAFQDFVTRSVTGLLVNESVAACRDCIVTLTDGAAALPAVGANVGSFDRFTTTNNQESGVDELDQLEADGNGYFYFVDGDALVVANGIPPAGLRVVAKLGIGGYADGVVLDPVNRRLVVARAGYEPLQVGLATPSIMPPMDPHTELLFVNVADPAAPVLERRLRIEGVRLAVRRIGARVHLVTHSTPFMPLPVVNDAQLRALRDELAAAPRDSERARQAAADIGNRVSALVAAGDPFEYLPNLAVGAGTQPLADITRANCDNVAIPDVPMRLALTAVTSVDSDGTDPASLTVASDSWHVYASETHVYLSQTSHGWWFDRAQRQETAIYKIEVGAGRPAYRAFGTVEGWVGSSFQLSEHNGFLRVAANRNERDPVANAWLQDNHLYVLADNGGGKLNVVGKVGGFGAGEQMFSTRFLGNRGFVVTFRQVDPLFTFDLSVPQNPRLVGELEIPGVSTYIHPLDAAHLLTIGYDGDQNRLNGQFQLQIFDVQDLSAPRLLHKHVPQFNAAGHAWTTATHDHLAFNYFAEGGTLTVPVQYYASRLEDHFSGFMAFSVSTANGFRELGRLNHGDLARSEHCATTTGLVPAYCGTGTYLEAAYPRRAAAALLGGDTYIYTLSNVGMKVSAAATFGTPIVSLPLPGGNPYPWLP